jgi:hypothetical protein
MQEKLRPLTFFFPKKLNNFAYTVYPLKFFKKFSSMDASKMCPILKRPLKSNGMFDYTVLSRSTWMYV